MTDDIRRLLFHTIIVAVKVDNMINKPINHMLIIYYDKNQRYVPNYQIHNLEFHVTCNFIRYRIYMATTTENSKLISFALL